MFSTKFKNLVICNHNLNLSNIPNIVLGGSSTIYEESAKSIGDVFDRSLSGSDHIIENAAVAEVYAIWSQLCFMNVSYLILLIQNFTEDWTT